MSDKGQDANDQKVGRLAKTKDKKQAEGGVFLLFSLVMKLRWEITTLIHVPRDETDFFLVLCFVRG